MRVPNYKVCKGFGFTKEDDYFKVNDNFQGLFGGIIDYLKMYRSHLFCRETYFPRKLLSNIRDFMAFGSRGCIESRDFGRISREIKFSLFLAQKNESSTKRDDFQQ